MAPTLRPRPWGPGKCWGQCPPWMGQLEEKLVSFSEAAAGGASLRLLPARADLGLGSRGHEHALQLRADPSSRDLVPITLSHSPAAPCPAPAQGRRLALGPSALLSSPGLHCNSPRPHCHLLPVL